MATNENWCFRHSEWIKFMCVQKQFLSNKGKGNVHSIPESLHNSYRVTGILLCIYVERLCKFLWNQLWISHQQMERQSVDWSFLHLQISNAKWFDTCKCCVRLFFVEKRQCQIYSSFGNLNEQKQELNYRAYDWVVDSQWHICCWST